MLGWKGRAEMAQQALEQLYWNAELNMYDIEIPCPNGSCNTIFHYWWMAHGVDCLLDGFLRSRETRYAERMAMLYEGIFKRNGGGFLNQLYDDMEWMAIAWLRAYQVTGEERYKDAVDALWADIKTGWNEHMGGGIAWQKTQLDYKNTPANAPAIILAARLYQTFGKQEDLDWALNIYGWQKQQLVDPESGFVWDGMNRTGDGSIDKDWKFTYCQGVYIWAGVELFRITKDNGYLADAIRTVSAVMAELTDPGSLALPEEGDGDGGLFKGILVRYLGECIHELKEQPERETLIELLERNAITLWRLGRDEKRNVFSTSWRDKPDNRVTLSTQLSAIKLLEQLAVLEERGLTVQLSQETVE